MSTVKAEQALKKICQYGLLTAPALILMLASLFGFVSPVFDKLPSEFDAAARMVALGVGIFSVLVNGIKEKGLHHIIIFLTMAVGMTVMLQTGSGILLDIALIILLVSCTDIKTTTLTVFAFFSCLTGATCICALKGYFRVYVMHGKSALGFRSLAGLYSSIALIIFSLALIIAIYLREKKTRDIVIRFVISAAVSALVVVVALKAVNLAAAVEPGSYQFFSRDTNMGIEVRMKGFDDYLIGLGEDEATSFNIIPDGDHYQITMDSYGITKTLCVADGILYAGNYDQSQQAHTWDIKAVTGTPYFIVTNVETGLMISVTEDSSLVLTSADESEAGYLRIGAENNEYYEMISSSSPEGNDISRATVTVSPVAAYTGSAVRPSEITVELNGNELQEGRDFEVTCWNNYLPGTAWADITGIGDYTGTNGASYEVIYADDVCDDPFYRDTADYVVRVYRMAYLRYPTLGEVKDYVLRLIGDNRTPDSVIWEVYGQGGFDVSNAQLIEAIYRLMLLRNGSRGELAGWIAELDNGATREDVINAISESPDYQNIWHSFGIGYR